ncbi:MAG: tetratricopeptide repeat protein [Anaerolineae bacterium]|nr:tetratricopeptide repeat protein [Anaerolineae bacterium]
MRTKLSIFCDRVIEAGWLIAAVAVPLFFNIYSARTFEPDKITLLRAIVTVMIAAWIIAAVERGVGDSGGPAISLVERFRRWSRRPLFLPTLLLVLVYIISTIFSISPTVSLWGSYQRMQGTYSALSYIVIFALMAGNLHTREQVDRLVTTVIITSIPVGLYGIIQHYGLDPLPWAGDVTQRVASNMGNAIFVASYIIMIVPLTLSRLIESMTAIIKEEQASWGHTILAAVYIFTLAVQIILVLFSGSRGPMLGLLGGSFVMGLLVLLVLRRLNPEPARLSIKEIGQGVSFMALLGLAGAVAGGIGFLIGVMLDSLLYILNYPLDGLPLLGAALGGLLGFLGLYTYLAAAEKGWRWLWLSWFSIGILAIIFVVALNIRGTPLDRYLDPVRELPYVGRLANVIETQGTGKVRVLIWDAAVKLVLPHEPLGIPGDDIAGSDPFNVIRPLIGYGPESMFNAFAYVYPPDLAHVEARGSSADRSHNETMDSLVITGLLGFLAFYFVVISLFYYALRWLGWAPDRASRRRLALLLVLFGLTGAIIPYLVDNVGERYTFMALGLPFGLVAGGVVHLVWQGIIQQKEDEDRVEFSEHPLLLIGLLGAFIGHLIEVHFVFSIAATYTYFWLYAGLMVALSRMNQPDRKPAEEPAPEAELSLNAAAAEKLVVKTEEPVFLERQDKSRRPQKRRTRRRASKQTPPESKSREVYVPPVKGENWETWVGSQGLAMAIILIILTFDFITGQFHLALGDKNSMSLLWMYVITWLVGVGITLSDLAVRRNTWSSNVSWLRASMLYAVTSLSYFFFYYIAHRIQFRPQSVADFMKAANIQTGGLVLFYIFLLLLMTLLALTLSWRQMKRLAFWRSENWWLYPPLVLAAAALIWFKNVDVVRADIYLKVGNQYRGSNQWNEAIALHEKARSIDSDEDFYYLMLALDYQLMAQDGNIAPEVRANAWQQGENIALTAREVNPYNPDNTGNMGRYYFTVGQAFDRERFSDALKFFEKAIILAPSNVIYHNLWAQTFYILQNYEAAIDRLKTSISLDGRYAPTWILLGDTYAAMGNVDEALKAHTQALQIEGDGFELFADQFLDQRLSFYVSAGRADDIIAAMQQVALTRAGQIAAAASEETREHAQHRFALVQCAVGHTFNLSGRPNEATPYLEECQALGGSSDRTTRELANIYLASESFDQALPLYQSLVQLNPQDVEAHSALAFIYARQGRLPEALQENQRVLEQIPNDYDTLKNMAVLYQQLGQWPEALDYARQAQAVAPETEQPSWQQFIADVESQLNGAN